METNMNSSVKELNLMELEGFGGGYIRELWKKNRFFDTTIYWQVINDKTGEVMISFLTPRNARAYARLMGQSTEELPFIRQ